MRTTFGGRDERWIPADGSKEALRGFLPLPAWGAVPRVGVGAVLEGSQLFQLFQNPAQLGLGVDGQEELIQGWGSAEDLEMGKVPHPG